MCFTEKLHTAGKMIWQESREHPFILALANGTLQEDVFRFYLIQDRYYLDEFQKVHERAAHLAEDPKTKAVLLQGVKNLDAAEVAVRTNFFKDLQITEEEIKRTPIAPTAYHYTSHLYRTLYDKGIPVTVAALLPCYWLYQEIGQSLIANVSPVPIYQKWIETYDSPDFGVAVNMIKDTVNRLAEETSEEVRKQMMEAFLISSYEELNFWQMAYEKQKWGNETC